MRFVSDTPKHAGRYPHTSLPEYPFVAALRRKVKRHPGLAWKVAGLYKRHLYSRTIRLPGDPPTGECTVFVQSKAEARHALQQGWMVDVTDQLARHFRLEQDGDGLWVGSGAETVRSEAAPEGEVPGLHNTPGLRKATPAPARDVGSVSPEAPADAPAPSKSTATPESTDSGPDTDTDAPLTAAKVENMGLAELQDACKARGLSAGGITPTLRKRLIADLEG